MLSKLPSIYSACILLASFYPFSLLESQGLYVGSGANLVMTGTANLVINDAAFVNSGNFIGGLGTVSLTGNASAATTFIGGTSNTSFYNLRINKAGGGAKLMQNTGVSNTLFMTSRNLDLNGFDANLGSTGNMSGEGENSYVFGQLGGYIVRSTNLAAPVAVNPGNMGFEITSEANLGATVVKRGHPQQVTSTGFSINRYFDITYANNDPLDATIKFFYLNAELAGITESELQQWGSSNSGASWSLRTRDAYDVSTNYVLKNNVNQLSRITLASAINNPLPVSLVFFTGELQNNRAKLSWATSAEVNNDHFELQRSADGRNFEAITTISGANNSTTTKTYSYTDIDPFSNIMYYRLKQVNRDGSYIFSKIVSVNINALYNNRMVQVYPNPTTGPVNILFTSSVAKKVTIEVTDIKGRIISQRVLDATKGLNQLIQGMPAPQGAYLIRIRGIDEEAFKVFKY